MFYSVPSGVFCCQWRKVYSKDGAKRNQISADAQLVSNSISTADEISPDRDKAEVSIDLIALFPPYSQQTILKG